MINAAIIYFTSKDLRMVFIGLQAHEKIDNSNEEFSHSEPVFHNWEMINFLILVVIVEHFMLVAKIFIE
jgi:hypothetical protein